MLKKLKHIIDLMKAYQSLRNYRTLCYYCLNLGLGPCFEFFEQCPEWHIRTASVITLTALRDRYREL